MRDAYAALAHARALPYVDGRRVGLMGGSHGGSTTLASMAAPENAWDLLAREKRAGFAAAVALYPGCGIALGTWRADGTGTYRRGRAAADPDRGKRRLDAGARRA